MEENSNSTVVIDVKFDKYIEELRHLTREYDLQTAALNDMKAKGEETTDAYFKLSQEMKVTKQAISGVEKQMQNEIKAHKAAAGSLNEMRANLANMQKQYDAMGGFERMGVEGQKLQSDIANLTKEIQGLEEETGRWQRNVGNYRSALQGLKNSTEAVGLSSKGLDRTLKALSGNPWMTVATVLVGIVVRLWNAMKDNEKVTAALHNAMDKLRPIAEKLGGIIGKLAEVFSNVFNKAIEAAISAIGWLGRALQKVGGWFGKDWGGGLIDYSERMQGVTEKTEEAAEANEDLAESFAKVAKEGREALATIKALALDESLKNAAKQNKALADSITEVIDRVGLLDESFEKLDPTKFDGMFGEVSDENLQDNTTSWELFAESVKNNAKEIEATVGSLGGSFGTLSSIYKDMAKDETKTEEERAEAARNAKRWAALQIAANSGTAIAKGIAGAMDVGFPANIPALAATLSAVLSAIAQAKQLAADTGYETGGVIGGFHGATMGHDNSVASVRTGEMVINARQQRQLFEIANGGSQTSLAASLAQALQAMPAPVVDYSEFTRFTQRVASLDEQQKLR